ncbi:hypothetical protein GCM10007063_05770 [Lentibacillus kapialis]|uniref:Uncharacterized protein n=1 Tax=Lentibacillus kapialis TaxID=340214 RepID=A0A917PNE4_9BACI|nr:hypothetical protein [Lentibacillus kapialis]GGJ86114.1 hypothetical protein GCM10007063_05770 [Lentibacillus kapialis]
MNKLEQIEHDYKNGMPINIEWLIERVKQLESENERFREALQEIAKPIRLDLTVYEDLTNRCIIANQALRGDNQ